MRHEWTRKTRAADALTDRSGLAQGLNAYFTHHHRQASQEAPARACTLRRLYSMGHETLDGAESLTADPNSPPRRAAPTTDAAVAPGAAHRAYDRAP